MNRALVRWADAPTTDGRQVIVVGMATDSTPLVSLRLSTGGLRPRRYTWTGWTDADGRTFVPRPRGPVAPSTRPSLLRFDGPSGFAGGTLLVEALPVGGKWTHVATLDLLP